MKNLVILKIEGDFRDNKCTILSTTLKVEGADSFPIFFTERQSKGNGWATLYRLKCLLHDSGIITLQEISIVDGEGGADELSFVETYSRLQEGGQQSRAPVSIVSSDLASPDSGNILLESAAGTTFKINVENYSMSTTELISELNSLLNAIDE